MRLFLTGILFFMACFSFAQKEKIDGLINNGAYKEALDLLGQEKEQPWVMEMKARAYADWGWQNQNNGQVGQDYLGKALDIGKEAVKNFPNEYLAHRALGYAWHFNQNYVAAKKEYYRVLELKPRDVFTYYLLWVTDGLPAAQALKDTLYTRAIELEPNNTLLLMRAGDLYNQLGNVEQAKNCYVKILSIKPDYMTYYKLGVIQMNQYELTAALSQFEASILLNADFSWSYYGVASIYTMQEDYSTAAYYFNKAIEINPGAYPYYEQTVNNYPGLRAYKVKAPSEKKIGQSTQQTTAGTYPKYYIEATEAAQRQEYETALTLFHQSIAEEMMQSSPRMEYINSMYSWMVHCYRQLGRYETAIEYVDKALQSTESLGAVSDLAALLASKSVIYHEWGDYESSIFYHLKSVEEINNIDRDDLLAIEYNNISETYREWGKYELSLTYADSALLYNTANENNEGIALNWTTKALAYNKLGKIDSAYHYAVNAYSLAMEKELNNVFYTTQIALSEVFIAKQEYDSASVFLTYALEGLGVDLKEQHPGYVRYINDLVSINANLGLKKEVLGLYDKLFVNLEGQIENYFPSLSEKSKGLFYRKFCENYEQFNALVTTQYKNDGERIGQMYDHQLKVKGLLLNNSRQVRQRILSSEDDSLINTYSQWVEQRELLAKAYALSSADRKARGLDLDVLEAEKDRLEVLLSKSTSMFTKSKTPTWQELQKAMNKGEAVVEMVRVRGYDTKGKGKFTDAVSYAAIILKKGDKYPSLVVLENGVDMEDNFYKYYKNNVKFESKDTKSYDRYWKAISSQLNGVKSIYFSPDGIYHKLNLNTLFHTETGQYLIDEMDIRLLTGSVDLLQKKGSNTENTAVIFGNPTFKMEAKEVLQVLNEEGYEYEESDLQSIGLAMRSGAGEIVQLPGTEAEVTEVSSLLKRSDWRVTQYRGQQALEEHAKKVASPTILHFATHGYFLESAMLENPLLASGLILAGADHEDWNEQLEDGFFNAYEVMNLNLENTELVLLSACETGLGEVRNGEGVYGLQRAFMVAGADAIIMSLWKVDDAATALLMTEFYKNYLLTKDKQNAFIQAQKMVRENHPHPKYWGAFVLVGH